VLNDGTTADADHSRFLLHCVDMDDGLPKFSTGEKKKVSLPDTDGTKIDRSKLIRQKQKKEIIHNQQQQHSLTIEKTKLKFLINLAILCSECINNNN
jgi:hypothetical protein